MVGAVISLLEASLGNDQSRSVTKPLQSESRLIIFPNISLISLSSTIIYNIHDKKLLAIFKEFQIWYYYLEGSILSINIVTNYKNLKYFLTAKVLIHQQVRQFEYLFQFNLVIYFYPGQLKTKLNTPTKSMMSTLKEKYQLYFCSFS